MAKRTLTILLAVVLSLCAFAQRPAYYKMSGMVREACREAQSRPAARRAYGTPKMMIAFVKLATDDTAALSGKGCKVLAQYGNLCVAEFPVSAIGTLSLDNSVQRIEAGQGCSVLMDTTSIIVDAVPVQEGVNLPQQYTGKGVVVGVQDIGFDLTHPTFWSSDMSRYRIKAMWDQLSYDTLTSSLPVGRDYVGQDALLAVKHPRDGIDQTHGTHTTGIAAGSGAEGGGSVSPYRGVASDADICLVCNATSNDRGIIKPEDYYKYTTAVDALGFKYIFDYAASAGKPCVINFSEGSRMDFRGDDMLYYEMLDSLVGPGRIIVASAGNLGNNVNYVRKEASEPSADIIVSRGTSDNKYVVFTTKSKGNYTVALSLFNNDGRTTRDVDVAKVLAAPDSIYTDSIMVNGINCKITASAYESCFDGSDIVCDWRLDRDTVNAGEDRRWELAVDLTGNSLVEMFPVSTPFYHKGLTVSDEERAYSINSPGSAPGVICVGFTGYRRDVVNYMGKHTSLDYDVAGGERTRFSSVGPTFDGRIKPDVMAPGQNIISAYSSFFMENHSADYSPYTRREFTYGGRTYFWQYDSGSSMSSPVVAGVIALWLQAYPRLTPDDCREIFARTCTHYDSGMEYPNNFYGYGQIDAAEGMKLVLQKAAAGIEDINQKPAAGDSRIYTLDGRYAGNDVSRLGHGIYIIGGKKLLK